MVEVHFYMKSGNDFVVKAKDFSITKLSGTVGKRSMSLNSDFTVTIDIDEIEAVIVKEIK